MHQNTTSIIIYKIDLFFYDYDFYYAYPNFMPNDNIAFGQWDILHKDDLAHNYTIQCYYSYDSGQISNIAKCTINIVNGSFNPNEISIEKVTIEDLNKHLPSSNYY